MINKCFDQFNLRDFERNVLDNCIPVQMNIFFSSENISEERFSSWHMLESDILFHLDTLRVEPQMRIVFIDLETGRKFNIDKELAFLRKLHQMTADFKLPAKFVLEAKRLIASDVVAIRKERTGLPEKETEMNCINGQKEQKLKFIQCHARQIDTIHQEMEPMKNEED